MRATWLLALGALAATSANVWGAAGSFDPTFGLGGRVTTDLGGHAFAQQVVRQPDGKIVAAGFAGPYASGPRDLALVRYAADGSLDASFGTGGIVRTVVDPRPQARQT